MTQAPQPLKIEHDGMLYLRWQRSSLDEAVEYLCDIKKDTFLSVSQTPTTSAGKVLDAVLALSQEVSFMHTSDRNVFNKGIQELRAQERER